MKAPKRYITMLENPRLKALAFLILVLSFIGIKDGLRHGVPLTPEEVAVAYRLHLHASDGALLSGESTEAPSATALSIPNPLHNPGLSAEAPLFSAHSAQLFISSRAAIARSASPDVKRYILFSCQKLCPLPAA